MKKLSCAIWTFWLLVFAPVCAWAQEIGSIDVQIVAHSQQLNKPSSVITVTIRNTGSLPVFIPKALSPLITPEDHLMTNIFDVQSSKGGKVRFIGRYVRVSPENPSSFFLEIAPNKSVSHEINLAADYDLSAGAKYTVSYKQSFSDSYKLNEEGEIVSDFRLQQSELATIYVDSAEALSASRHFAFQSSTDPAQKCTSEQQEIIATATWTGYPIVFKALKGIESLYFVKEISNSNGYSTYQGRFRQDNAYTYWFGSPINNTAIYHSKPSYTNFWKSDNDYIMMKFMNSAYLRAGTGRMVCGCDPIAYADAAAWTEDQNRIVHYCDKFFKLKMTNGLHDSQVLTVIHELTHFIDMWGEGTGDYAYGHTGSHSLTLTDRDRAVRNADNLTYYIGSYIH